MVNYVSPGVYVIEKDISEYAPSINTSIVGAVGFASKGPVNKATLITSQNNLIRTFGEPTEDLRGQGLEGSMEILEQTNSLYYIRAAADTAADASATMSIGSCPSVVVSGAPDVGGMAAGWGVGRALTLRVQVYDDTGTAQFTDNSNAGRDFSIPAGTSTDQGEAIRKIVGGGLDADKIGCFFDGARTPTTDPTNLALSGALVGSFAGSGASIGVSSCTGTSFLPGTAGVSALKAVWGPSGTTNYGISGLLASAVRAYGSTVINTGTNSAAYSIVSLYPGTGYNGGTKSDGTTSGNSITVNDLGSQNFNVLVNQDGITDETFKCSFVGSGAFIEDVINTGETNTTSDTIKGNLVKGDLDATPAKLGNYVGLLTTLMGDTGFEIRSQALRGPVVDPALDPGADGTPVATTQVSISGSRFNKLIPDTGTSLTGGSNGDEEGTYVDSLVGTAAEDPKTGMQSLDEQALNIGIALVPGIVHQDVQNALITLAETTQNFLALVSPPYAIGTVQDAIDWSNGKSSSTAGVRTAAINSSYAAIYWPWVQVFSVFDGKNRWLDPSIYGARQMAFTDAVAESWFAPAGYRRGRLTKPTDVEVKLNQGDRDSLYSGGNVVNPIVSFPQQGITIFGQRTTQRSPTALDRINIRRLMIYIRKIILLATQRFVFEPNDEFTWAQIEGVLNPFLDDIRRRRGITEFRVVCDETVNTPLRIDRNELWTKVLIKPTKTAEILIFEINLTNQSAQLGSL
jgi:phage tail sheath protein FI